LRGRKKHPLSPIARPPPKYAPHVIPEPPHRHSRVGLSGIHLGLQPPEAPG